MVQKNVEKIEREHRCSSPPSCPHLRLLTSSLLHL